MQKKMEMVIILKYTFLGEIDMRSRATVTLAVILSVSVWTDVKPGYEG